MAQVPSRSDRSGSLSTCQIGAQYEQHARRYLERAGLRFIAANARQHKGELDLIMLDSDTLVFIEVRYRSHSAFGSAITTITRRKQRILLKTAALWLAQRGKSLNDTLCRFDVLAITGSQLQWLPNAFGADESLYNGI